jgi:hypothetical protein
MKACGARHAILLEIKQFYSDTYFDIQLKWHIIATVFSAEGSEVAKESTIGDKEIAKGGNNPGRIAQSVVPKSLIWKLKLLLTEGPIFEALKRS